LQELGAVANVGGAVLAHHIPAKKTWLINAASSIDDSAG